MFAETSARSLRNSRAPYSAQVPCSCRRPDHPISRSCSTKGGGVLLCRVRMAVVPAGFHRAAERPAPTRRRILPSRSGSDRHIARYPGSAAVCRRKIALPPRPDPAASGKGSQSEACTRDPGCGSDAVHPVPPGTGCRRWPACAARTLPGATLRTARHLDKGQRPGRFHDPPQTGR